MTSTLTTVSASKPAALCYNKSHFLASHLAIRVAERFLSANGVAFEKAESIEKMETADIAEKAERFTVLVGCWQ